MIIGFSGGGKSTLAIKLGDVLGIAPTHLDRLHWLPGWKEDTLGNKIEKLRPVVESDSWIIDGNYKQVLWRERLERSDTIIFIDVNRVTSFKNAFLRSIKYKGATRPDMGDGCEEKFDLEFAKWILIDGRKKRRNYLDIIEIAKRKSKEVHVFRSSKEVNRWLESLQKNMDESKSKG